MNDVNLDNAYFHIQTGHIRRGMNFIKNRRKPIFLNIYSFCQCCNAVCGCLGLGLYHTAIEIEGIEYMFHGFAGKHTGVSEIEPHTCPYRFEEQVLLGETELSFYDLEEKIIEPLRKQFISNTYDLLNNNCNHFALVMAEELHVSQKHTRGKIFRVTDCLNTFRCCIPNCILSGRLDWFNKEESEEDENYHYYDSFSSSQYKNKYFEFIEEDPVPAYSNRQQKNRVSLSQRDSDPTFRPILSPHLTALKETVHSPNNNKNKNKNKNSNNQAQSLHASNVQSPESEKEEEKKADEKDEDRKFEEWEVFENTDKRDLDS